MSASRYPFPFIFPAGDYVVAPEHMTHETVALVVALNQQTSEERRRGKECNSRWSPLPEKIIDVDKFKEINDTWGHNTGDEILRKVSQAFYDNVRSSDYVFRYGGDEFIIVLTEASENETLRTAERIRSRVEKTKLKAANGEDIALSLSIGAAMFNGHPDYERLIQIADEALYIAKRRGRNRVELWKASL